MIEFCLFVLGTLIGSQLNRGIYGLAWQRRPIGPWATPAADAPPRQATDRIPCWAGGDCAENRRCTGEVTGCGRC